MKTYELSPEEAAALRSGEAFILQRPPGTIGNFLPGTRCILVGTTLTVSSFNKAGMPGEHFRVSRNRYDFEKQDQTDRVYWEAMAREEIPERNSRMELKPIRAKALDADNPATHQGLVERAAKWLAGTKRCPVVIKEGYSNCAEFPDAIGYYNDGGKTRSITVECKASRSDFLNDRKKTHRFHATYTAKGDFRFYLVAEGVKVDLSEIPAGWGLLRMKGERVRVERDAEHQERTPESLREEVTFMFAIIRKTMFDGPGFIDGHSAAERPKFVVTEKEIPE